MLSENKLLLLEQLVQDAPKEELIWLNGYLAGLARNHQVQAQENIQEVSRKPLILYGTETGNSKKVATQLLASFKKNKIQAKIADVFQYDFEKLSKETDVLFVVSTQGDGEFPQNAQKFYNELKKSNQNLAHLKYSVLGLGDSAYPLFCNAGILLDQAFEEKNATRLLPLVKADVDYEEAVKAWEKDLYENFKSTTQKLLSTTQIVSKSVKKKNYTGEITHKVVLNDRGSNKETYHIEITPDEEVFYESGDALGVIPHNKKEDIERLAKYFQVNLNQEITVKGETKTVESWLSKQNIRGLGKSVIEKLEKVLGLEVQTEKIDLLDIFEQYNISKTIKIEDFIDILHPIAPRLYSIASSKDAHEGQIHLTVGLNKFSVNNVQKTGLASQFLADYPNGSHIEFYIHKNTHFRLPSDETDIIMIGPGTGIAPFRSFLAERNHKGAEGKNWLFFGEQHFVSDFYYQTEIQEWFGSGVLTNLDVAFSRDQAQKIYVQDRIQQKAKEFNAWLENGANLYICGQKSPMSEDVENTILAVIAQERKISLEQAKEVLEGLELAGKYQKDVY
jgi:sulfite reductase (NADPH) flavoprotein alpha-component